MTNITLKRFWPIAFGLIVVLASFSYLLFGIGERTGALTVSGTVEVVEMMVGIDAVGQVAEVLISDGDRVDTGELLIL